MNEQEEAAEVKRVTKLRWILFFSILVTMFWQMDRNGVFFKVDGDVMKLAHAMFLLGAVWIPFSSVWTLLLTNRRNFLYIMAIAFVHLSTVDCLLFAIS
jgi:hypothetical protein